MPLQKAGRSSSNAFWKDPEQALQAADLDERPNRGVGLAAVIEEEQAADDSFDIVDMPVAINVAAVLVGSKRHQQRGGPGPGVLSKRQRAETSLFRHLLKEAGSGFYTCQLRTDQRRTGKRHKELVKGPQTNGERHLDRWHRDDWDVCLLT